MAGTRTAPTRLVAVALILGALVAVAYAAAFLYDQSHRDRIARGITVDGVAVGGLGKDAAVAKLQRFALRPRLRALHVRAAGRSFPLPISTANVQVDINAAVSRAVSDSRRGWLGSRVVHEASGQRVNERLPLVVHYDTRAVSTFVSRIARTVGHAPTDAKVVPAASGLTTTPGNPGVSLDAAGLRRSLDAALRDPMRPSTVTAATRALAPQVTTESLAAKYPAYIVVDRKAHQLRFFQHLKLSQTYDIAVGRAGLETPSGLYDVQWKEVNPPWHVPNSAWAGSLAGKTIPPGPQDPIKARWMAFDGGAGIHGIDPSEYSSIGHDASHGCVRMRIPDVISLYARTPVGTPVYVA